MDKIAGDGASPADLALVERLRAGGEAAFMALVEEHQAPMLRIARMYVSTQAVAEEVVGDACLGILRGLDRFEGRSSLRTRIYRILVNIAKTRGAPRRPKHPVRVACGGQPRGSLRRRDAVPGSGSRPAEPLVEHPWELARPPGGAAALAGDAPDPRRGHRQAPAPRPR